MDIAVTPHELEQRAAKAGLPIIEVCRKAGVSPSNFYRWRGDKTEPSLRVLLAMNKVIAEALPGRRAA